MENDETYMRLALEQARAAAALGEVPIGAVVVCDGQVVGAACNRRETDADPASHAEFTAMEQASRHLGRWRLSGCTVYVTLEPCLMCAGLMHQARIDRCVYGAADPKAGALGSLYQLNADERLNHTYPVTAGVLEAESALLLQGFFRARRAQNKAAKLAERAAALETVRESIGQEVAEPEDAEAGTVSPSESSEDVSAVLSTAVSEVVARETSARGATSRDAAARQTEVPAAPSTDAPDATSGVGAGDNTGQGD